MVNLGQAEHLVSKCEALEFKLQYHQKKKKKVNFVPNEGQAN
jgi:hypothetical protein